MPEPQRRLSKFVVLFDKHIIDVIYYDSMIWNFGLLTVAIGLHLALAGHEKYPPKTRYRIGERDESELPATHGARETDG